jgi:colanic acid biosynthesis glycosyl transferase WcaI
MSSKSKRVLVFGINYSPELTGIAPYTVELARGLRDRGHRVEVITGYPHYPGWRIAPGFVADASTHNYNGVLVRRVRHFVPSAAGLLARLRMEVTYGMRCAASAWHQPDVIVCVSPAMISSAMDVVRARCSRRRPAIGVWIQDLYSLGLVETGAATGITATVVKKFESALLRSADGIVVIHDRFRDHAVQHLGVDVDSVTVIRNWTHLSTVDQPKSRQNRSHARYQLGWSEDEVIVLHAGNMGAKQGLENVIAAARLAEEGGAPIRFVLLGDGNQRQKLERMAAGLTTVSFLRPLPDDDFRSALAASDILLVNERPGVHGMAVPSKLTSYFTTGLPVLAAVGEGSITAEEIRRSGGGLVVSSSDPQAMVDAALRLKSDPELSTRLGAEGESFRREQLSRKYALDRFNEWILHLADQRACKDSARSVNVIAV